MIAIESLTKRCGHVTAVSGLTGESPKKQLEASFDVYPDHENSPREVERYRYDGASCLTAVEGESLGPMERSAAGKRMETARASVPANNKEDAA